MSVDSIWGKSFEALDNDYKEVLSTGDQKMRALNAIIDVAQKVLEFIKSW